MTFLSNTPSKLVNLPQDIYNILGAGTAKPSKEDLLKLGEAVANKVAQALEVHKIRSHLSASQIGEGCDRKTAYAIKSPEKAEKPSGATLVKFLLGHLHEEIILFLAKATGKYKVTEEQRTVTLHGVPGHIDAIINGELVDIKSANSRGIMKFKNHELNTNDPFGYQKQLDFYREGLKDAKVLEDAQRQTFIASDKELGHIIVDSYRRTPEHDGELRMSIARKQEAIASDKLPDRGYAPKPFGKSGNMVLGTECKYCPFKKECWPSLRTFVYSDGPVFFTTVTKEPNVPEAK